MIKADEAAVEAMARSAYEKLRELTEARTGPHSICPWERLTVRECSDRIAAQTAAFSALLALDPLPPAIVRRVLGDLLTRARADIRSVSDPLSPEMRLASYLALRLEYWLAELAAGEEGDGNTA